MKKILTVIRHNKKNRYFRVLTAAMICLAASAISGCHTIRPPSQISNEFQQSLLKKPQTVGLILDENYRTYVSKDRGNAVSDPQKYLIGESLTPLTIAFFQASYQSVNIYESFPERRAIRGEQFFVQPEVTRFENDLEFSRQEILIILSAKMYGQDLSLISNFEVRGKGSGGLNFFTPSKSSSQIVGTALQDALSQLLKEIQKP